MKPIIQELCRLLSSDTHGSDTDSSSDSGSSSDTDSTLIDDLSTETLVTGDYSAIADQALAEQDVTPPRGVYIFPDASSKQKIPTIAEIKASTKKVPREYEQTRNTVAIIGSFAIKYGRAPQLFVEAESMRFLAQHCPDVPVPRVHAVLWESMDVPWGDDELEVVQGPDNDSDSEKEDDTFSIDSDSSPCKPPNPYLPRETVCYIVMDLVKGTDLERSWNDYSRQDRDEIAKKVKMYMDQIRAIPSPGYIGDVSGRPCRGDFWLAPDPCVAVTHGPFRTHHAMLKSVMYRLRHMNGIPPFPRARLAMLRDFTATLVNMNHSFVFTHGDIQMKNIMVYRDAEGQLEVTIIDWESAGWYPEYWEFSTCIGAAQYRSKYLRFMRKVVDPYPLEYTLMEQIRSYLW